MRLRLLLPLLPAALAACSPGPSSSAGDCILAAQVDGAIYGAAASATAEQAGPVYAHTMRQRGCDDVIEFGQPSPPAWQNGDSSFPPGTPLYAAVGRPTSEVLLVQSGPRWIELQRLTRN
ncbi:MAG TPA: hypothetical protein VF541_12360 [Longimicrobium sp.]|jgi:hypothetical protein